MLRRTISGLCFFLLLGGLLAHAGQFQDAPQYTVGTNPQGVAMGDFNNDGKQDMAVVNSGSNTVSVLLGNGDGTFTAKSAPTTGSTPYGVAIGDFNGDGKLDMAVTNSGSNSVSVFLGNGDGTFAAGVIYTVGNTPQGIAVADFTGDGNLDLVVANSAASTYQLLLGSSTGTFTVQTAHNTLVNGPTAIVVGDFNNDGHADFAIACKSSTASEVVILLNTAASLGTFTLSSATVTGIPVAITAGDFDGDGNVDLAVVGQPIAPSFQGVVTVLFGTGNGGFGGATHYNIGSSPAVSSSPSGVVAGHFTNSNSLDLAVTAASDNTVNVLVNDGTGNFATEVRYGTGFTPFAAAVADVNGDGKSDLIVTNFSGASVSVLLGNGDVAGSFQSRIDYDSGPQPNAVVVGDFNGDHIPDLAFALGDCATCTPNAISLVLGKGDGTFEAPNTYATGTTDTNTYALVAADFDGDGNLDIATANNKTNNVSVLLGNGTTSNTFQPHVDYPVGSQPVSIANGDFNQDGSQDLVTANFGSNNVSVLTNNGDGTFKAASNYAVGTGPYAVARGNFNADKFPDLVVVNETAHTVSILLNNGDGTFAAQVTYPTTLSGPTSVAIGDFNGDGKLDLAVGDSAGQNVAILLGNGDGTFQAAVKVATGANVSSLVAGDFNHDGKTDLALASSAKSLTSLLLGKGDGTFQTAVPFSSGAQASAEAQSIAAADLNSDGLLDLVVANGLSSTVSVLLNTAGTFMSLNGVPSTPSYGTPILFTAQVSASISGAAAPTGTVTFTSGSTTLQANVAVAADGTATLTTATLPVGVNIPVTAAYSGGNSYLANTASTTVTISQAGTTTTLSALTPVNAGQSVVFTAQVCPGPGCPATAAPPTGTVNFMDGVTQVGSGTVGSTGIATSAAVTLAAGSHSITAVYIPGSDPNYATSTSPAGTQLVNGPSFTLAASELAPPSVSAGSTSTSTITITPTGGLSASSVSLSCAVSSTVSKAPTCTVGAISGTTATLTVSTTAATTAMAAHHSSFMYAMWFLLPAMVFGSVFVPRAKRSQLMMLGAVLLISAGCIFQSACGGGSPKTTTTTTVAGTPSGSYSVTVTGTATGAANQTAGPLTLTVQ